MNRYYAALIFSIGIPLGSVLPAADQRQENPLPKCVQGFMIVKTCTTKDTNAFPSWLLVDPNSVMLISNDPASPDHCVKIVALTGRGFFVKGSEASVAAERERARNAKCDP